MLNVQRCGVSGESPSFTVSGGFSDLGFAASYFWLDHAELTKLFDCSDRFLKTLEHGLSLHCVKLLARGLVDLLTGGNAPFPI